MLLTTARPKRGRPKGSGIDDSAKLRDIASLLRSQPHMRPTTAIKMLGETDPSVIRRLRDKFYAMQSELARDLKSGASDRNSSQLSLLDITGGDGPSARACSLPQLPGERRQELPRQHQAASDARAPAAPLSAPAAGEEGPIAERLAELAAYNVMLGFAIQATIKAMRQLPDPGPRTAAMAPMASILRQQIELGETVMSMAWPRSAAAQRVA